MQSTSTLVSPVLVGRDDLLQLGERRLDEVARGRGHVLFLAGEAGIGKTRLLGALTRAAAARGFTVATADLGPGDTEVPAALLIDLTRSMARRASLESAAEGIRQRLVWDATPRVDRTGAPAHASQLRRVLVSDVADILLGIPPPVVLTLENLHWADELSLEVLGQVAGRLHEAPILLLGTYRSDELVPGNPMRGWRTRLITQRLAEEARLPRLTPDDLGTMATVLLESSLPAPRDVVEALHRRTDGVPLYVEELLGALRGDDQPIARLLDGTAVPDTIEFAVRERLERRSAGARTVAEAAAVIGRSFSADVAAAVMDVELDALADPLRELLDHYFLVELDRDGLFEFRHVLIRDAIYGLVPGPRRAHLHGRVAERGSHLAGAGDAFASAHFEQAGRSSEAHDAALAGARAASRLSAHREAARLYARVLRTVPPDLDDAALAGILEASAVEAAAIDDNETAARQFAAARDRYVDAGMPIDAAAAVAPLVAARHLLGDDLEARTRPLESALAELNGEFGIDATEISVDRARLRLLAGMSAAYMLDRRLDESVRYGREAAELAARLGDRSVELNARITVGSDLVFAGRMEEGWAALEDGIRAALADGREEEAARAWRMAGSCASVLVEYARGERYLEAGIDHGERTEQWNHRHYMAAHLANVRWATGRWDDAQTLARHVLADGRGGITTRITALLVLGYVAVGRGLGDQARASLQEALKLGTSMRELQRISPALWGLAEVDVLRGDISGAIRRCEEGRALSAAVDDAAYLFPFLVTGTRARLAAGDVGAAEAWVEELSGRLRARAIPGTLPALDHAAGLVLLAGGSLGRAQRALESAVGGWARVHRVPDRIAATIDAAACHLRAGRALAALDTARQASADAAELRAAPLMARADAIIEAARARHPDASPWAPLTSREYEVARLIAAGRTNASIAAELGIAARTVGAHIEHMFAKLGAGRRAEIAAWTASLDLATVPSPAGPEGDRRDDQEPGATNAGGVGRPTR